jgi:hypothetical protein
VSDLGKQLGELLDEARATVTFTVPDELLAQARAVQAARIRRLAALARKAWPTAYPRITMKPTDDRHVTHCLAQSSGGEWLLYHGDPVRFEAALRVLAGEPPQLPAEVVICAAIRLPDGRVFRGHRHGDCIRTAEALVTHQFTHGYSAVEWTHESASDQGFVTSATRYVDREEGLRLQLAAGIESVGGGYRGRSLFSEDLY